jgi:hypothetical protein
VTLAARNADGFYAVGGNLYPSVSKILTPLQGAYPDDPRFVRRGTLMHAGFEAQLRGTVDGYVDEWLAAEIDRREYCIELAWVYPYVAGLVEWTANNIESVEWVETPGVSTLLCVAGTADARRFRLRGSDGWWIGDPKSQEGATPDKWHVCQLALLNSMTHVACVDGPGEEFVRCDSFMNIYVDSNGSVTPRTWTKAQIYEAYMNCCWPLICQYRAREVVTTTQRTVDDWRSRRTVAGYWPERTPASHTTATQRRADAERERWTRPLTEAK